MQADSESSLQSTAKREPIQVEAESTISKVCFSISEEEEEEEEKEEIPLRNIKARTVESINNPSQVSTYY